jgi:gamma-glutamyltranspeptidase/glutathione hydrolase
VYDGTANVVRTLDFLPRGTDGGAAPAMMAGIAALNAEFGEVELSQILTPAEQLARFGHPVSAGLAADLQAVAPVFTADPAVMAVFGSPSGGLLRAGDTLTQPALADGLRQLTQGGIATLVRGPVAIGFADHAAAAGAPLASGASAVRARFAEPIAVEWGNDTLWFPADPAAGGAAPALLFAALDDVRDYDDAAAEERPHLMAEALARAYATGGGGAGVIDDDAADAILAGYDPARTTAGGAAGGDTSFGASVVAFSGNYLRETEMAVACGLTMNGLFGSGRLARESGMFVAAPEQPGVQAVGGLVIETNPFTRQALYVGAGADLPTGLTAPLVETLLVERPLREAIAEPRVMPDFSSSALLVERSALDRLRGALEARGHSLRPAQSLGRATVIHCGFDSLLAVKSCDAAVDPRGFGSAYVITR